MSEIEYSEPQEPTERAVRFGRIVFCTVGAIMLGIGGWFSYGDPQQHVILSAFTLGCGFIFVWLGLALPRKIVANFGFWLPWFIG